MGNSDLIDTTRKPGRHFLQLLLSFLVIIRPFLRFANLFAGIAGAIWLGILARWDFFGYGLIALVSSLFILFVATLPESVLSAPAQLFLKKRLLALFHLFNALSAFYIHAVLTIWCMTVLLFFASRAHPHELPPALMLSYAVATSPLGYMAQRARSLPTVLSVLFAQTAYIVLIFTVLLLNPPAKIGIVLFGVIMLLGVIAQLKLRTLTLEYASDPGNTSATKR